MTASFLQAALVSVLTLAPVYLTYRVWGHYRYTKALEKALSEKIG
jgi:hypothetical protein